MQRSELITDRFDAMGSTIIVGITPSRPRRDVDLLAIARDRIDALEQRWSRFIPSSEISLLNEAAGGWMNVSPDTQLLVRRAIEAWSLTDGAFDPTILPALRAQGYTESIERVQASPRARGATAGAPGCDDIDCAEGRVRLPPAVQFDPGGIGKGLAADLVVEALLERGAKGACVEIGGDVRAAGEGPEGRGWVIGVADPDRSRPDLTTVWLTDGAVASSSTLGRRWVAGGDQMHHLIDPSTGQPTKGMWGATVVSNEGWLAEALSTAVMVSGSFAAVERVGAAAIAVSSGGDVRRTDSFEEFET